MNEPTTHIILVHTLDRVRSESPCLLSSMVAAASKFFRPDLHRNLMDHSLAIVSRAVAAGACDTGLVQSLMIHVYWKSPTDRTAWVKLGMAIRMAYQLRWHEKQASQDELPEMDLRRLLVSEPTLSYQVRLELSFRIRSVPGIVSLVCICQCSNTDKLGLCCKFHSANMIQLLPEGR